MDNTIHDVLLSDIDISDLNVRHKDRLRDIDELKDSIEKHGLLQPVVLMGELGHPKYKLIVGQRRFTAHHKLGRETIRAIFSEELDNTQIIIRSLVENMQRGDLDYSDTARAITSLYTEYSNDERRVAEETGLSLRKVRDFISLDALASPEIKEMLSQGSVTPADAKRAIKASSGDSDKAENLLTLMTELNPTTNQKKRIVLYGQQDSSATPEEILERAFAPHVEETLIVALPEDIRQGITLATQEMNLDPEEFTLRTIREWLNENGYLTDEEA